MTQETEAARLVARVRADISQYEREMARAGRTMDTTARQMESKAKTAAQNTSRSFDMLGKAIAGVFTVTALRKVDDFAGKLADLNERVTQVRGNYARMLEGGDVTAGLRELREATGGGADNLFLMEAASRLMAVHLADSNQEAAELLRVSAQLGKFSKGLTVSQSVDNLLPLLSNQSALRLDEFGLSGERVKALAEKYEAAGMESGAAFKRAFMEEAAATLEALGMQAVSEAEKLAAARLNAQAGFAQAAGSGILGQAYSAGRSLFTEGLGAVGDFFSNLAERRAQMDQFVAGLREMKEAGALTDEQYRAMISSLVGLNAEIEFTNMTQAELAARINGVVETMPSVAEAMSTWEGQIKGVDAATSGLEARLEQLDGRKIIAEIEIRTRYEEVLARGAAVQEAYDLAGVSYELQRREDAQSSKVQQWLASKELARQAANRTRLEAEAEEAKKGGGSGLSDYERRIRAYESELRSAASAAFAPSSVTQRDWWETNLGQYQDKPDEYLRRLRSAMTDPMSQWKDLLGGRTGDAAELFAAQQEELWRTGQWSQMGPGFDAGASQDAIVNQMIQRIQGERSRQAMIENLIRDPRLQALGMSASEMTALTGTPMAGAGVEQMNTLVTAAGSVDVGRQLSETIDKQFRSTEELWVTMGETAMSWFTSGFTNLAPEIAAALARTLLGPLVDEMERTGVRARP